LKSIEIEPTVAAFAVMVLSMGVDGVEVAGTGENSHQVRRQALEADALHFSTDVWSSGVVILGLLRGFGGPTLSGGMVARLPIPSQRWWWPGLWCM